MFTPTFTLIVIYYSNKFPLSPLTPSVSVSHNGGGGGGEIESTNRCVMWSERSVRRGTSCQSQRCSLNPTRAACCEKFPTSLVHVQVRRFSTYRQRCVSHWLLLLHVDLYIIVTQIGSSSGVEVSCRQIKDVCCQCGPRGQSCLDHRGRRAARPPGSRAEQHCRVPV